MRFFGNIAKFNTRVIQTILVRQIWYPKTSYLKKILGKLREKLQCEECEENAKGEPKCKVRKFIFSEVSCFSPATLLKNEPFHRIISKVLPRFWMAAFELWYTLDPFTDTSRSEAVIRNYGKILKNWLRRSSFLNLIKLNASNCHLLKMDSIWGFSKILSKSRTICYGLFGFSEHIF